MPPDLPNEQELMLKKRARRRLVGAIALVLLMVIILPQILQDRTAMMQQEPVKITMTGVADGGGEQVVADEDVARSEVVRQASSPVAPVADNALQRQDEKLPAKNVVAQQESVSKKTVVAPASVEAEKKPVVKAAVKTDPKPQEAYTVQVGVYSDLANVKRLQEQLKQAGFSTYTEKVKTPKGDSVRLKAGNFTSRQDAVSALAKLKAIGLPGIVVGNE